MFHFSLLQPSPRGRDVTRPKRWQPVLRADLRLGVRQHRRHQLVAVALQAAALLHVQSFNGLVLDIVSRTSGAALVRRDVLEDREGDYFYISSVTPVLAKITRVPDLNNHGTLDKPLLPESRKGTSGLLVMIFKLLKLAQVKTYY